jgi:hypothetical protein
VLQPSPTNNLPAIFLAPLSQRAVRLRGGKLLPSAELLSHDPFLQFHRWHLEK